MSVIIDGTGTIDTGDLTIDGTSGGYGSVIPIVYAEYYCSIAGDIPFQYAFYDFDTKVIDTHNAVLGAGNGTEAVYTNTWRFVVPITGIYSINSVLSTDASFPGNVIVFTQINVNNAERHVGQRNFTHANGGIHSFTNNTCLKLNQNDIVSILLYSNHNSTNHLEDKDTSNRVTIARIGS